MHSFSVVGSPVFRNSEHGPVYVVIFKSDTFLLLIIGNNKPVQLTEG